MSLSGFSLITYLFTILIVAGEEPLTVTLFYESYCPACKNFYLNVFYNDWYYFKGRVWFDLIPYGNAKQWNVYGHMQFQCQHGPKECHANKLHACAALQACGDTGTSGCDVDRLGRVIDFISCLLTQPDQALAAPMCAKNAGLDYTGIYNCANGVVGKLLLHFHGSRTLAFHIPYTPTVLIDGSQNKNAQKNLVGEICRFRPQFCTYSNV